MGSAHKFRQQASFISEMSARGNVNFWVRMSALNRDGGLLIPAPHHIWDKIKGRTAKAWPPRADVLIGRTCFRFNYQDRP